MNICAPDDSDLHGAHGLGFFQQVFNGIHHLRDHVNHIKTVPIEGLVRLVCSKIPKSLPCLIKEHYVILNDRRE